MTRKEKLAKRYLLWAFSGNPWPMRSICSPSNKKRAGMIRNYARLARRPEIACQLPGEETLSFFEAEPKQAYAEKLLAIEAMLLGIRELERLNGTLLPEDDVRLESIHKLQIEAREAPVVFGETFMAEINKDPGGFLKDPEGFAKKVREEMQDGSNS